VSWEQLQSIVAQARQAAAAERDAKPTVCPYDGTSLDEVGGILHCPFDGWTWPPGARPLAAHDG
jgi:hypothetical protein